MANGEHIELAKAYITVIPSLEGAQANITKELTGATVEASDKAGKESGTKFGESFSKTLKTASVAIGAALAGAGAAAVTAGKQFVQAANDVSAMGDSIGDNAAKMGISTKAYQEWDFVLKRAGSSIDAMRTSMKTLQNAAAGNNDAFKELGITQEELQTLSPEQLFNRTVSALQGVENTTQRTALASKLLGKGAVELGGIFDMTAEETEAAKQKMYELGAYMDEDAIAASDNYQDTMQDMQDSITGLKTKVITDFLPGMTSVMTGVSKVFSGKGGVEEIQSGLQTVIHKITTMAPQFLPVAQTIITSLISGFGPMIPDLTAAIFSVIITAISTITSMIPSMMPSIISGIQGIIQATISALPVIISGLTQLIMALVQWLSSDGVVQDLVNGIVQMVTQLVNSFAMILPILLPAIVTIISEVCKALTEPANVKLLLDAVLTLVGAIFVALVNCVPELIELVKGVLLNLGDLLGDFLYWVVPIVANGIGKVVDTVKSWGTAIKTFISNLITGIRDGITSWISNLKASIVTGFNFIKDKISSILGNIGDFVKSVIDKLKELPTKAVNIGKDLIQGLIDGIKKMATKAVDSVKDVGKSLVNGIKGVLKIGSPSKVFEQIGEFTAEGFAIGYEDQMADFKNDMAMGMNGLTASMVADISAYAPDNYGGSGDTYNGGAITINVYGAEGQSIKDLAQEIAYRLESMTKRKEAIYA
jgi:hypothetical protein